MNQKNNDLQYVGSFSTLQTINNNRYMTAGAPTYTEEQNRLYSRLLIGLKLYDKKELYAMNQNKKSRIERVHEKAQNVLNLWKQELIIESTNRIFSQLFPNSKATQYLVENSETMPEYKNTMSFKDLGIRKEDIVAKFLEARLLPANFHSL